jgi:heme peroxidase
MGSHGRVSSFTIQQQHLDPASVGPTMGTGSQGPSPSAFGPFSGFRHFIYEPAETQRYKLVKDVAFNPSNSAHWNDARELMRRLAKFIRGAPKPTGSDLENPDLPSGYTYFLQLIAHDLVHSSISLSHSDGEMWGLKNVRDTPLCLDTIYGGGPTECPHAYQVNGSDFRSLLRLGNTRKDKTDTGHGGPPGDIARATTGPVHNLKKASYPEALIGDPRNDSHAIISQMVALFHRLHNTIAKALDLPSTSDRFADAQRRFVAAQAACVLIYRNLIRHDLLPRLLDKRVLQAYQDGATTLISPHSTQNADDWQAAVEFTSGFFRFAHAMIRPIYLFNKQPTAQGEAEHRFEIDRILHQNSEKRPELMPFEMRWLVDWDHFFKPDASNRSIRIGPWSEVGIGQDDDRNDGGLIARDLLSSIAVRPWSIRALVEELRSRPALAALLDQSPLFELVPGSTNPPWAGRIRTWLEAQSQRAYLEADRMKAEEMEHLADDPPIPFFVRFEAEAEGAGKHLGILGSIVLAETIYDILQSGFAGASGSDTLADQIKSVSRTITDGTSENIFAFLVPEQTPDEPPQTEIRNFEALLRFLKSRTPAPAQPQPGHN